MNQAIDSRTASINRTVRQKTQSLPLSRRIQRMAFHRVVIKLNLMPSIRIADRVAIGQR